MALMRWVGPVLCSAGLIMGPTGAMGAEGSPASRTSTQDSGAIAGMRKIIGRLRNEPENKTVTRKTTRTSQQSSGGSSQQRSSSNQSSSNQSSSNSSSQTRSRSQQSHANNHDDQGLLGRLFSRDDDAKQSSHSHHNHQKSSQQNSSQGTPQDSPNKIKSSSSLVITPVQEEEPLKIRSQATPRSSVSPTIRRKVENPAVASSQAPSQGITEYYQEAKRPTNSAPERIQIRTPVVVSPLPMILPNSVDPEPRMPEEAMHVEAMEEIAATQTAQPAPVYTQAYSGPIIAPTQSPSTTPTIVYTQPTPAPAPTPTFVMTPAPAPAPTPTYVMTPAQAPAAQPAAPVYQQAAPVYQQTAPAYQQTATAYQQTAPAYQQAAPVYQQTATAYQQPAPVYQQAAPANQQTAPVYQQATPVYQQTAPVVVQQVAPAPQPTAAPQGQMAVPVQMGQVVQMKAAREVPATSILSAAEKLGSVQLVSGSETESESNHVAEPATAEVSSDMYDGMGHAADYRWIQGRLQFVHSRGGAWLLRYAPLDVVDKHGGSMVLKNDGLLAEYKEGDRVRIEGEIISERTNLHVGGPLYMIRNIVLLESAGE